MAIADYDSILSDYLYVKIQCKKCGKEFELGGIDPNKIRVSKQLIECDYCHSHYDISTKEVGFTSYVEVEDLPDENLIAVNPIQIEYYSHMNTCFIDMLYEKRRLKNAVEEVSRLSDSTYLYESLWCRTISMMDYCVSILICNHIRQDKEYKIRYMQSFIKRKVTEKEMWTKLSHTSFQYLPKIRQYFMILFDIDVAENRQIEDAVKIRNSFMHHHGRGEKEESLSVTQDKLLDLIDVIASFIEDLHKKLRDYDIQQAVKQVVKN